jgi:glycosyltransferase
MRMGGLSTDRQKRQMMWNEDVEIYRSHGFAAVPTKLMKMAWKVPQFISAKFVRI